MRNNHGDETLLILLCGGDFLEAQVSCEPYQLANEGVSDPHCYLSLFNRFLVILTQ